MSYLVVVELDVHVGAGDGDDPGSDERFAEVALSWLEGGARLLGAETLNDLMASKTPPPYQEPWEPGVPWGPPGAVFGLIHVSWAPDPGSPLLRHAKKAASAAAWRWLAGKLRQRPFAARVELRRLDETGHPVSFINLEMRSHLSAPGWLRLQRSVLSHMMTSQTQAASLELLREFADRLDPSYGQIGVVHGTHGHAHTTLEQCLPRDRGCNEPWNSIVESRQWLRGYPWVTVLAREHVVRLGGVGALAATGAFHRVEGLSGGGALLQATEDFHAYDQAAAERVFRVLAPVLRPGLPAPPPPGQREPYLIVYEDAATAAKRA